MSKVKDGTWLLLSRIAALAAPFVVTPLAARILSKEDLGAWALIQVVVGFLSILQDGGLGNYVIRHPDYSREVRSMTLAVALILGAAAGILLAAAAVPVTWLMGIPNHWVYILPLAVACAAGGLCGVLGSELRKELRFKELFVVNGLLALTFVPLTWLLLVSGWGLWAYPFTTLGLSLVQVLFLGWRRRPLSFKWEASRLGDILSYTRGLLGFNLINYWARSADNLLVGRFLGPAPLAIYANAYRIMLLPISQVIATFTPLVLPYMTRHNGDQAGWQRELFGFIRVIGCLVFPAMTFLWLEREFLIDLYLGPGWGEVATLLAWFIPLGMLQCLISPLGNAYMVSAKNDQFFKIGMVNTAVVIIGFVAGLPFGITGVAIGYVVANLLMCYPNVTLALRSIGAGFPDWISRTWPLWLIPCLSIGIAALLPDFSKLWQAAAHFLLVGFIGLTVIAYLEGKTLLRWIYTRRSQT